MFYKGFSLVLWCLMPLSTIFQLYHGISFIGGGNQSIRRKSDLPQVNDKLYDIMLYPVHIALAGF